MHVRAGGGELFLGRLGRALGEERECASCTSWEQYFRQRALSTRSFPVGLWP